MSIQRGSRRTDLRRGAIDVNEIFSNPTLDADGKVIISAGNGAVSLGSLTDVNASTLQAGEFLKYDGAEWVNHEPVVADLSDSATLATTAHVASEIAGINFPVDSVNGATGAVVLTASSINAIEVGADITLLTNDAGFLTSVPTATTLASGTVELATDAEATAASASDKALVASNIPSLSLSHTQISGLSTVATSGDYVDLSGTPTLATVATSGSYNDLSNTPAIPVDSVNGQTGVVVLNAGNVGALAPGDNVSSLINDAGYLTSAITASSLSAGVIEIATNAEAGLGTDSTKALVPANVSSLSLAATQVTGLATVATSGTSTDLIDSADLARLDSPAFTNTPTAPTAGAGTSTTQIATTAFVDNAVSTVSSSIVGSLKYSGTIAVADFAANLANATQGSYYKITAPGTAGDGRVYSVGDSIIVNADMGGTYSDSKIDKIDNVDPSTTDEITSIHTASNYTVTGNKVTNHLSGIDTKLATLAPLASPVLTGTPTAPTAAAGTNSTQVATTEYVDAAVVAGTGISSVSQDTTPQLGGPLDVNVEIITSASNANVKIDPDGTGEILVGSNLLPDADATHSLGSETSRYITTYSDLNGAVLFKAKADVSLTKGDAVYITGNSGGVPTVNKAQANSSSTMPAFGLALTNANLNAEVQIVSFGNLQDYNTTTYNLGLNQTVYVSETTAGALTTTAPAGESNFIQNIGKVVRADAAAGIIKVGGAGRSNATPNLDDGKIFLGDSNNKSVSTALSSINLSSFNDDLTYPVSTVNTQTGNVVLDAADLAVAHTAANYTAATQNIEAHLVGIDSALASSSDPNLIVVNSTSYTIPSNASAKNLHVWYGTQNNSTFTIDLPTISSVVSSNNNGSIDETFEIFVGRRDTGTIKLNSAEGIDEIGGSVTSYQTAINLTAGQWIKIIAFSTNTNSYYLVETSPLHAYNNLSDLPSVSTARTNLGLGDAAVQSVGTGPNNVVQLDGSSRLPAVDGSQLTNLPAAAGSLLAANNLSDVANISTSRANLGLGNAGLYNVGTQPSNVVQLDGSGRLPAVDGSLLTNLPSTGISNLVEDTSPQLGGNLDVTTYGIEGHLKPSSADTYDLGSSTAEWRDLFLGENSKINFGTDQDVELKHNPNNGLILDLGITDGTSDPQFELLSQTTATFGPKITFNTQKGVSPAANDRLGQIEFRGKDSVGNSREYGLIIGQIADPTNGAHLGKIALLPYPSSQNAKGLVVEAVSISAVNTWIPHDGGTYGLKLGSSASSNATLVTATGAELNILDGSTSTTTSITLVDTDGFVVNDGGTTKLIPASDLKTYLPTGTGSLTYSSITTSTTAVVNYHYSCNGTFNLTLPNASGTSAGDQIRIKNIGTGTITVKPQGGGSDTIDGSATDYTIDIQWASITLVSNGSNGWEIV